MSSSSARPPPLSFVPPTPRFAIGSGSGMNTPESEPPSPGFLRDAHHANTAVQMPHHNHGTPGSSPPVTPRSLSFLSPTSLQRVARAKWGHQPVRVARQHPRVVDRRHPARELQHQQPPQQRQLACVEALRARHIGPAQAGRREAFASSPARPLTIYASAPQGGARLRRDRPKSTAILVPSASVPKAFAENPLDADGSHTDSLPMLDEKQVMKDMGNSSKAVPTLRAALDKPWLTMKDPRARYALWITYATVVVFGLGMGALRIYLGQRDVTLQDPAP
ncbi:hypothetical protein C8J57DRAFT_1524192 [Mycena rebaudengoi]|nr:hypothetical protein C8J57DRAFT_1524192 [Mycena rebaudengoi]